MDSIALWRGKPIEDLTREELIEALSELAGLYQAALNAHKRTLDRWEAFLDVGR